jgi:hypothetical protein
MHDFVSGAVRRWCASGQKSADRASHSRAAGLRSLIQMRLLVAGLTIRRALSAAGLVLILARCSDAEPVRVRFAEGLVHGFLALRAPNGALVAEGDLIQVARGTRVTSRLVFRFRDGSVHDETAVFSQQGVFRLVSDHLIQKGPSFPHPLEMSVEPTRHVVIVRYTDDDGKEQVETERLDQDSDLANGMLLTMLKNVRPTALPQSLSFVVATPKPRIVKLKISLAGRERFVTGGTRRTASHYLVKIDLGGLTGLLASLAGKQPPDSHVWILGGEAPAFVKSEQPLYAGGPLWRIELVSPVGPRRQ